MAWQYGLIFDNADQFIGYIRDKKNVTITEVHVHHTWEPSHADFDGTNYLALQDAMKNYHVNELGWSDIAQHITIFPDGKIVTGRDINVPPASMTGYNGTDNAHPFMFEMLGNFDRGYDRLDKKQIATALKITKYFMDTEGASVVFHNERSTKTCPGSGILKSDFLAYLNGNWLPEEYVDYTTSPTWDTNPNYHRVLFLTNPMMKGEDVKALQQKLKDLGYYTDTVDGIWGIRTTQAVQKYKKLTGWTGPEPLEIVNQEFWTHLGLPV